MVAALHRAGLGVVMDVVYNHTYHGESIWSAPCPATGTAAGPTA